MVLRAVQKTVFDARFHGTLAGDRLIGVWGSDEVGSGLTGTSTLQDAADYCASRSDCWGFAYGNVDWPHWKSVFQFLKADPSGSCEPGTAVYQHPTEGKTCHGWTFYAKIGTPCDRDTGGDVNVLDSTSVSLQAHQCRDLNNGGARLPNLIASNGAAEEGVHSAGVPLTTDQQLRLLPFLDTNLMSLRDGQ